MYMGSDCESQIGSYCKNFPTLIFNISPTMHCPLIRSCQVVRRRQYDADATYSYFLFQTIKTIFVYYFWNSRFFYFSPHIFRHRPPNFSQGLILRALEKNPDLVQMHPLYSPSSRQCAWDICLHANSAPEMNKRLSITVVNFTHFTVLNKVHCSVQYMTGKEFH